MSIFEETKTRFEIPPGMIYLDGNSLGPLPKTVSARLRDEVENQWANKLIHGWNESGWYTLPQDVGAKIADLIGASPSTVTTGDSTTVSMYKLLHAALALNHERKIILTDSGNFPTDVYTAQGIVNKSDGDLKLKIVAPEEILSQLNSDISVLMLTHVDYRTGRMHNMEKITAKAHELGVITIWDLCHTAGAMPVDLIGCKTHFALGCGYKYLNGGPGAPAFIYVREDLINDISPAMTGWMGHEAPFNFDIDFKPTQGIGRMKVGTPPILALASLDAALDVWQGVDMHELRERSIELSQLFITQIKANCPQLKLASPIDPLERGSQVSWHFEEGYAVIQVLASHGVIGDFRMPDIMRFGITPLYIGEEEILKTSTILAKILTDNLWDAPEFKQKKAVT